MKATIEFNLDDPDEQIIHLRAVKATELALAIWEFVHNTRRGIESRIDSGEIEDRYTCLDIVYEKMREILQDYDINIDKLVV